MSKWGEGSTAALLAGISATAGATSTVSASMAGRKSRKLARQLNEKNHQYALEQNKWNAEQVDIARQYESPENQKNLLMQAGYNPALLNSEGGTVAPAASADLATEQYNGYDPAAMSGFNQGIQTIANAGMEYLQAKKIQSETNKITNEIPEIQAHVEELKSQTHMNEASCKEIVTNIDLINTRIKDYSKQWDMMDFNKKVKTDELSISWRQLRVAEASAEAHIAKAFSDIDVNKATIKEIANKCVLMSKQALLTGTQIYGAQMDNIVKRVTANYAGKMAEAELGKVESQIYNACTSVINRTLDSFEFNLDSAFGFKPWSTGAKFQDRINNKGGFFNQY